MITITLTPQILLMVAMGLVLIGAVCWLVLVVAYILDSLIAYRNNQMTGKDCNTCDNKYCTVKPNPGETVRYNCVSWRGKNERTD